MFRGISGNKEHMERKKYPKSLIYIGRNVCQVLRIIAISNKVASVDFVSDKLCACHVLCYPFNFSDSNYLEKVYRKYIKRRHYSTLNKTPEEADQWLSSCTKFGFSWTAPLTILFTNYRIISFWDRSQRFKLWYLKWNDFKIGNESSFVVFFLFGLVPLTSVYIYTF